MVMTMTDSTGMTMNKVGYMDRRNSFMAHRFNILMKSDFVEDFTAFANIEFLHEFNSAEGIGSLVLEEGWFQYTYSDALKIKGGVFLTAFGAFNKIHDASPTYWSTRTPIFFDEMYNIHFLPERGNLEFSGKVMGKINYNIHFSNGEGVDKLGMDLNSTRSVGSRIGISPFDGLILGFSGHADKAIEESETEEKHGNGIVMDGSQNEIDVKMLGVDFSYELSNFKTYGEFFQGSYQSGTDKNNKTGYFFVAGYTFGKLTPFIEYDYFKNPDDFLYKNEFSRSTIGINYKFNWRVALKLEALNHSFKMGGIDSFRMYQTAISVLY